MPIAPPQAAIESKERRDLSNFKRKERSEK